MKFLTLFLSSLLFIQCNTVKITKKPPFNVVSATYTPWIGGMPGSKGIHVSIALKLNENILFNKLYFQNKEQTISVTKNTEFHLITTSFSSFSSDDDLILHEESKEEFTNKVSLENDIPFILSKNQAILSYTYKEKEYYYKIDNLKKGKTLYHN